MPLKWVILEHRIRVYKEVRRIIKKYKLQIIWAGMEKAVVIGKSVCIIHHGFCGKCHSHSKVLLVHNQSFAANDRNAQPFKSKRSPSWNPEGDSETTYSTWNFVLVSFQSIKMQAMSLLIKRRQMLTDTEHKLQLPLKCVHSYGAFLSAWEMGNF